MKRSFYLATALHVSGLTQRQLDALIRAKLFTPSIAAASGKGSNRLFSFDDLVALRILGKGRELGLSYELLRWLLRESKLRRRTKTDLWHFTFGVHRGAVRKEVRERLSTDFSRGPGRPRSTG